MLIASLLALFRTPLTTLFLGVNVALLGLLLWLARAQRLPAAVFLAVSIAWWAALSLLFVPQGANYQIYRYNAGLTLAGSPAFGRADDPAVDDAREPHKSPAYLDYTGAQHLIYVGLAALAPPGAHPRLLGLGFQLWSLAIGGLLLWALAEYGQAGAAAAAPLVVMAFHPVFSLHWLVYSWEDKAGFALVPLALLLLIRRRRLAAAAAGLGLAVSLNGLLVFWLPLFGLYLYQRHGRSRAFLRLLGLVGLGALIGLIPFFPASLSGWAYRAARMSAEQPFWFSIYLLLPPGLYHPLLDKALIGAAAAISTWLYGRGRLSLTDGLVVAVALVLLLGPYNVIARVLPLLLLIMALAPGTSVQDWLGFCGVITLYFLVSLGYSPATIRAGHVLVFYLPVAWTIGLYIARRRGARGAGPAAATHSAAP